MCSWRWTEWSSCQVLCDLNGQEPVGPRKNRTREKFFPDDPHNLCPGGQEMKKCDQECQSKIVPTKPSIRIWELIPQNLSPLAIGFPRLFATIHVDRMVSTLSGGPAPQQVQTCPRVTLATTSGGRRHIDQEKRHVRTLKIVKKVNNNHIINLR